MRYTSSATKSRFAALVIACCSVLIAGFDVRSVTPSVYRILVDRGQNVGLGTGFLVGGSRFVVTNNHVIDSPNGNVPIFIAYDQGGQSVLVQARLVKRVQDRDLALLEAQRDLPGRPLTLGVYEPDIASDAFAIGYPSAADTGNLRIDQGRVVFPANYFHATVTRGTISRFLRNPEILGAANTVQHTAPVNPGNSGGPLFDNCNNVIGVNTLGASQAQNIFYSSHAGELIAFLRPEVPSPSTTSTRCTSGLAETNTMLSYLYALAGLTLLLAGGAMFLTWRRRNVGAEITPSYIQERVVSAIHKQGLAQIRKDAAASREQAIQPPSAGSAAKAAASPRIVPAEPAPPRGAWAQPEATSPAVPPERPIRLVPLGNGETIEIARSRLDGGAQLKVGRALDADIQLDHHTVSKAHARLFLDDQRRVWIEDAGSSNGTFANGQRVTRIQLIRGQLLKLGDAEYKIDV